MSGVRNKANQLGFDPSEELAPLRPWRAGIDYEIEVPLDYWVEGSLLEPHSVAERTSQLRVFLRLLRGDYRRWARADALFAFHSFHVNYMARVLMSTPPEITGVEGIIKPRTLQTLLRATRGVITDMVSLGTGLYHVTSSEYGAEVNSLMPLRWYPASPGADVYVNYRGGDQAEIYRSSNTGEMEYRRVRVNSGFIGANIEEPVVENAGSPELWKFVQEAGDGRVGSILNIPREPASGDWGQSIFPYITDLVLMYNQRQSQINQILQRDGNPLGVLTLDPNADPPVPDPDGKGDTAALEILAERVWYDSWRKQHIVRLKPGETFDYKQYKSALADQFDNLSLLMSQMFLMTGIPDYLHGVNTTQGVPSGVALELMNLAAVAYSGELITSLIAALRKLLLICAIHDGHGLPVLQRMLEEMVIEWPNALTMARKEQVAEIDKDGETDVGETERDRDESDVGDGGLADGGAAE